MLEKCYSKIATHNCFWGRRSTQLDDMNPFLFISFVAADIDSTDVMFIKVTTFLTPTIVSFQESVAIKEDKVLFKEPMQLTGQSVVIGTMTTRPENTKSQPSPSVTEVSGDNVNKNVTLPKTPQASSLPIPATKQNTSPLPSSGSVTVTPSLIQCTTSSAMPINNPLLGHGIEKGVAPIAVPVSDSVGKVIPSVKTTGQCVSMGTGLKHTLPSKVATQGTIGTPKSSTHSLNNSSKATSSPSLRAIAPQPRPAILPASLQPGSITGPQGPTQITIPIVQGNVMQGTSVLKLTTPLATTPGTPVSNIAALVASLPANMVSPGQTQLIRFVTPSGATITVQGTIQTQSTGKSPGTTTITVPKTITTNQLPSSSQTTKPVPVAPKTVGASTVHKTVSLARPQQPSATKMLNNVLERKEKYPVLEPVVKDPRKLLERQIYKWRQNRCSMKSVYQLPRHRKRVFGRRSGMKEVPEFMYVTRGSGVNWATGFPRPSFKVGWRYRTQSLRTLAGAGLQARILHACLKWEDINVRPPRSNSSTICTSTGQSVSQLISLQYTKIICN